MKTTLALFATTMLLSGCTKSQESSVNSFAANEMALGPADDQSAASLGKVTIGNSDGDAGHLLYEGKPLNPPIDGNTMLSIVHVYTYPAKALYVVQDTGGTACPATYYVVAVTSNGASATNGFGSCSDLVKIAKVPGGLSFRMPGYANTEFAQEGSSRGDNDEHLFTYRNGRVTERKIQPVRQIAEQSVSAASAQYSSRCYGYWIGKGYALNLSPSQDGYRIALMVQHPGRESTANPLIGRLTWVRPDSDTEGVIDENKMSATFGNVESVGMTCGDGHAIDDNGDDVRGVSSAQYRALTDRWPHR